eukprot:336403-Chlamydomonas_euryale.AAC.2
MERRKGGSGHRKWRQLRTVDLGVGTSHWEAHRRLQRMRPEAAGGGRGGGGSGRFVWTRQHRGVAPCLSTLNRPREATQTRKLQTDICGHAYMHSEHSPAPYMHMRCQAPLWHACELVACKD